MNPNSTVFEPESACEQVIFSGGGFSNIFALPTYQETQVKNYLKQHPPQFTSTQFNNSGKSRAFPDLSANGANFVIGSMPLYISSYLLSSEILTKFD